MFKFKTDKELTLEVMRENKALKAENLDLKSKVDANLKATRKMVRVDELTKDELVGMIDIYPKWKDFEDFETGDKFQFDNKLFEVIQPHPRQEDWVPGASGTESLYNSIMPVDIIGEWVPPTGAPDAYHFGDKMIFTDGLIYESTRDDNVWSPIDLPGGWKVVND